MSPASALGAVFVVELESALAAGAALRRVLDLREHDRIIPFTRVRPAVSADELTAGTEFVARTGLGPVGFDDVMRVEEIGFGDGGGDAERDGDGVARAIISKHAPAIRGTIRLTITPAVGGSHVRWEQEVLLPWLPRFVQGLAARVVRAGYRRVLGQLLR